ncbi:hypothetical protein F383_11627 [Gossypium arboreum]|uniref:Uncharacterized protein n=1 Tax=Gossypium arboreum TaxID=29729 RepID=A0A0B0NCZ5_GOSAR|nr:hypothetical protein F383_11627 [Gossypium arboreum]
MPVCLTRVPFEMAIHTRVPGRVLIRGYTDLYHTASHMLVCKIVWSILTSF